MNQKDYVIISHLRQNARESLTSISRKTKIRVSTIYEKLKRSENSVIVKNTCLVDFSKLGFNTRASIFIQSSLDKKQALLSHLLKSNSVNSVYKINNGFDFMVESIFKNMLELEEFIENLRVSFKVKRAETYYIISDLKREAFLSSPETLSLII